MVGGGSAVEIALVLIVFGIGAAWWMYTSWGWEKLRRRN
jgi:hypothetical protein